GCGVGSGARSASQAVRRAAVIITPRRFSPVEPDARIERRIQVIAGRLRRRGAISEEEYRVTLGLPPEAEAPAIDSTLLARPETKPARPIGEPPAAESGAAPDKAAPDTVSALRSQTRSDPRP